MLPTLLELLDIDIPDVIDGRSFADRITDGDDGDYEPRERVFGEMTWHDMYNPVRAIRTDRYKYIRNFWHLPTVYLPADVFASESGREVRETDGTPARQYEELYDLRDAPQEDDNVVYEPRYQDVRQDLSRSSTSGWTRPTIRCSMAPSCRATTTRFSRGHTSQPDRPG